MESENTFPSSLLLNRVMLATSGTLHAIVYCNLHGLWASMVSIEIA